MVVPYSLQFHFELLRRNGVVVALLPPLSGQQTLQPLALPLRLCGKRGIHPRHLSHGLDGALHVAVRLVRALQHAPRLALRRRYPTRQRRVRDRAVLVRGRQFQPRVGPEEQGVRVREGVEERFVLSVGDRRDGRRQEGFLLDRGRDCRRTTHVRMSFASSVGTR